MIRELYDLEYINYSIGQPYNIVIVLRLEGHITRELLESVLIKLQLRHPLLKTNIITNERGKPVLTAKGVLTIPLTIKKLDNEMVTHNEFRQQLITPFDYTKNTQPLIRITMFTSNEFSDIIICVQHSITDGLSMFFLARDLIDYLNNPQKEVEVLSVPLSKEDIFPPKVRRMIPKKPILANFLFVILRIYHRLRFGFKKNNQDLERKVKDKFKDVEIYSWKLTDKETDLFLKRCKKEQVSVHAALCTAFLPDFGAINSPVNLRTRLNFPIGEAFGMYAAGGFVGMKYRKRKSFWVNAQKNQRKLLLSLRDRKVFGFQRIFNKSLPVLKINKLSSLMVDFTDQRKSIFMTNLGSLDRYGLISNPDKISLQSFYGAISHPFGGTIALIFTLQKEMYFHLHYLKSEYDLAKIKHLVENVTKRILENI
ncbi:MAG: hypothetical protein FK734_10380 [Asgard group archaeon]|nr:hypothetical protein [Asgard group archaeon]